MITLRRAEERHHDQHRQREVWLTFHPVRRTNPPTGGFESLENLYEMRLPPGASLPRQPRRTAEIVTYVREGALECKDSRNHPGVIGAGEFQCMTTDGGGHHRRTNPSRTHWTHVFQVWLRAPETVLEETVLEETVLEETVLEEKRFTVAERRGLLRVVASPDARRGSLRIHQEALMYSALLDPGKHVAHELLPGRSAWLHLVRGEVTLGDVVMTTGDGAGFSAEHAVSLTAQAETEILLVDLGQRPRP